MKKKWDKSINWIKWQTTFFNEAIPSAMVMMVISKYETYTNTQIIILIMKIIIIIYIPVYMHINIKNYTTATTTKESFVSLKKSI